jgi:hypothetical protein
LAGLNFAETAADEADVPVAEAQEVPGGLPCAVPVVGDDVVEVVFFGVIVDKDEGARAVHEVGEKTMFQVGANEEDAVYEFLVEEFEVLTLFGEFRPGGFKQDFVAEFGGAIVNAADDFTEVNVCKCMSELGHENCEGVRAFPSERASHLVGLVAKTLNGLKNAVACDGADAGIIVQNKRNRGERNAALASYVFDRGPLVQ